MATNERIVLDPTEVISGREEFDITNWIDDEGIDWGEATIEPIMAEKDRGDTPVDFRLPNREITAGLSLVNRGTVTAIQARAKFQAKVSLFQKEGGVIRRVTNGGGTVYADVVDASLAVGSPTGYESGQDVEFEGATVSFVCLPDFYEAEVDLGDNTETTLPEITFTETSISGDYPARCRIVVDDDSGNDQRGLIYGFRSRHYSADATAALAYQAEALGPVSPAAAAAISGASGGTVVRQGTLSTSWTPVMNTNMGGTSFLTHTGSYRFYARVYSTSGTTVQARLVWDVNDLVNPVENDAWRLPGASNFYLHDFGEVRLDPSPVGTHRWQGQIQARGDVGTENFSVDRIELVPVDEGMGVLTAPINLTMGAATYSARSEFNTEAGSITGDSLTVGGTWAVVTNSDASDFTVGGGTAGRAAISDTGTGTWGTGRAITASTTSYTNIVAQLDVKTSDDTIDASQGLVLRSDGANSMFLITYEPAYGPGNPPGLAYLAGYTWPAGLNVFGTVQVTTPDDTWYTLRAMALEGGMWAVWFGAQGQGLNLMGIGQHSALATGGAQASGRVGIFDQNARALSVTRSYDNFSAWVPTPDAVTFGSATTQLTTDGHYRLDSGGTAYGPVSYRTGDLPRFPVSGLEGRTSQIFLKSSRGDFEDLPDSGIDDISARVYYSPSWLTVPDE